MMSVDLLRQQQRWKDGLQELRTGFASLESQVGFHIGPFVLKESDCQM